MTGASRRNGPSCSSAGAAIARRTSPVSIAASRCGPTSITGTSKCAAATQEANSVVSRTIRSGRSLCDQRQHPRQRGARVEGDEQLRTTYSAPGASPLNTGAHLAARSHGSPSAWKSKPARSTMPRAEPGAATTTSWPARAAARANGTNGWKCPPP